MPSTEARLTGAEERRKCSAHRRKDAMLWSARRSPTTSLSNPPQIRILRYISSARALCGASPSRGGSVRTSLPSIVSRHLEQGGARHGQSALRLRPHHILASRCMSTRPSPARCGEIRGPQRPRRRHCLRRGTPLLRLCKAAKYSLGSSHARTKKSRATT